MLSLIVGQLPEGALQRLRVRPAGQEGDHELLVPAVNILSGLIEVVSYFSRRNAKSLSEAQAILDIDVSPGE